MKVTINIEKKYAYSIISLLILIVGFLGVNAYDSDMTAGDASVFGHSAGELHVDINGDGVADKTLQAAINDGDLSGGSGGIGVCSDCDSRFVNEGQANSINAEMIAADAVGSSEVIDNSLTASDLATDSVGASEIAANAVGNSELIASPSFTSIIDSENSVYKLDPNGLTSIDDLLVAGDTAISGDFTVVGTTILSCPCGTCWQTSQYCSGYSARFRMCTPEGWKDTGSGWIQCGGN